MKNIILTLLATGALIASLAEARTRRSVGTLTVKAVPRVAVQGVTDELRIECRPSPTVKEVLLAVLIHLERIDENGTTALVASKRINALEVAESNRTSADGYLQSDKSDDASYLTVTINNPVVEDAGIYQCRFAFIDVGLNVHTLGSKLNVTVSELPPAFYPPSTECDCDNIWTEIENLKVAVAAKTVQPFVPAAQFDERCRTAFSARFATRHGYQIVADNTAIFDYAITNKGNAYSASTGVFTAPCGGQYFFTATLRSYQNLDSGYVDGVIVVDDEPRARTSVFVDAAIDNYQSATNGVVLTLNEGQKVRVVIRTTSSGEFVGEDYSVFSGFYLFP